MPTQTRQALTVLLASSSLVIAVLAGCSAQSTCFVSDPEWYPSAPVAGFPGSRHPVSSPQDRQERWRQIIAVKAERDTFCTDAGYTAEPPLEDWGTAEDIEAVKMAVDAAEDSRMSLFGMPWRQADALAHANQIRVYLEAVFTGESLESEYSYWVWDPPSSGIDGEWVILQWQGVQVDGDSAHVRLVGIPGSKLDGSPGWKLRAERLQQRDVELVRTGGLWRVSRVDQHDLQSIRHPP